MEREKYFESPNCENVKELIYYAVEKYSENIAYIIKEKKDSIILNPVKTEEEIKFIEKKIKHLKGDVIYG